jgi:hypothetical protein
VVSEHFPAPSAADPGARPGPLATTLNALGIKALKDFLFRDDRFLERVNTRSLSGLAPVVIQKYLKTILDNSSRSQYCSLRQEELPRFKARYQHLGKYRPVMSFESQLPAIYRALPINGWPIGTSVQN